MQKKSRITFEYAFVVRPALRMQSHRPAATRGGGPKTFAFVLMLAASRRRTHDDIQNSDPVTGRPQRFSTLMPLRNAFS